MRCPWVHEHSRDDHSGKARGGGDDSSAALLPPTGEVRLGAFRCQHAHCVGRTILDVIRALPYEAIERAARAHPAAYQRAVYRLALNAKRDKP
ncbi:hypothetical protein LVJ94_05120 [Pendulispora rubella]|uniref:Uncharacterized protein n=1 Tax=Pendulispora rubella TaxID=2741070 RepID=A0ABZ2L8E1_9BACT